MVMEGVWLVLAFFCLVVGIRSTIILGFDKSYMWFILTVVAALMYLLRRFKRKNYSPNNNS